MRIGRDGRELSIAMGILMVALGLFYYAFLGGRSFLWEDLLYIAYPAYNYQAVALAAGRFPGWLDGLRCGMPYFSEPWTCYPPVWLLALFVRDGHLPSLTVQWLFVAQYLLGSLFAYVFMRELCCSWRASVTGAVVFVFSGFLSLHIIHGGMGPAFLWLPLELCFVKKLVERRRSMASSVGLILSIEISLLAGFPQSVLYNAYFLAAYWLFLVWQREREAKPLWPWRWAVVGGLECLKIAGIFVVVALLGMVVILSTLQSWSACARQEFGFAQITDQSLPWYYLIHGLVPNFFGMTNGDGSGVPFWGFNKDTLEYANWHAGAWMYWEFGFYAGQLALVAVVVLLANVRKLRESRREAVFFLGALLPILLLMLGRYGGLFNILYHVAPGLSMFRTPARFSMLLDFCLAVLVAVLVDLVRNERKGLKLKWPLWLMGTAYAAFLVWVPLWGASVFPELKNERLMNHALGQTGISIALFAATAGLLVLIRGKGGRAKGQEQGGKGLATLPLWLLLGFAFLDLYLAFHKFHQGTIKPEDYYADRNGLIAQMTQMRDQAGPFRFAQLRDGKISEEVIFPRNIGYLYRGYEALEGYTLFGVKDYGEFNAITNDSIRLDIENVGVIANADRSTGRVSLMRYTNSLPRAKLYHDVRVYDDTKALYADLEAGRLDYRHAVGVLRDEWVKSGGRTSAPPGGAEAKIHFTPVNPDEYTISYQSTTPGVIFVSESYYPGWLATLDGRDLPVIHAFGAFKGIVVPEAGSGVITVKFSPKIFKVGLAVSLTTLAGLIGVWLWAWRRERKAAVRLPGC